MTNTIDLKFRRRIWIEHSCLIKICKRTADLHLMYYSYLFPRPCLLGLTLNFDSMNNGSNFCGMCCSNPFTGDFRFPPQTTFYRLSGTSRNLCRACLCIPRVGSATAPSAPSACRWTGGTRPPSSRPCTL